MSYSDFGIILQARTNSSRLPNKIILNVDEGQSFLEILLSRLKRLEVKTVIATSDSSNDDIIECIGEKLNVPVFRGSETNVLDRFIKCAQEYDIMNIVRVCSDNPFLDLESLEFLIKSYEDEDYLSYSINSTPSILTHYGFFAEIVHINSLLKLQSLDQLECIEHVTNCIYKNPDKFNVKFIPINISTRDIRCTLDTPEDFEILKIIYFEWFKKLSVKEQNYMNLIKYIKGNSDLLNKMQIQINKNRK